MLQKAFGYEILKRIGEYLYERFKEFKTVREKYLVSIYREES